MWTSHSDPLSGFVLHRFSHAVNKKFAEISAQPQALIIHTILFSEQG